MDYPNKYTDLYAILGISRSVNQKDLKAAYRRQAKAHHPDKNLNNPNATIDFQKIGYAFETLADPERRRQYDRENPSAGKIKINLKKARSKKTKVRLPSNPETPIYAMVVFAAMRGKGGGDYDRAAEELMKELDPDNIVCIHSKGWVTKEGRYPCHRCKKITGECAFQCTKCEDFACYSCKDRPWE